jgi:hypothetical protein
LVKASVKDAGIEIGDQPEMGDQQLMAKSVDAVDASPKSKQQAVALAEATLVDELKRDRIGGKTVAAITVNITGGSAQGVVGAENVFIGSMSFGPASGRAKS